MTPRHIVLVAAAVHSLAAALYLVPALHPTGNLRYLLPSPLGCALALTVAAAFLAGAANLPAVPYFSGSLAAGAAMTAWFLVVSWVYTNPTGRPGVGPSLTRYLLEAVSSPAQLLQVVSLVLLIPALVMPLFSLGRVTHIVGLRIRARFGANDRAA